MPKTIIQNKSETSQGFTLIELLVVIAIIGVLTAVLLANMVGIRERSHDAKAKNDLKQFKTALRLYYNDTQGYPDEGWVDCSSLSDDGEGNFVSPTDSDTIYMRDVTDNCEYFGTGTDSYVLRAVLRNSGDPDLQDSADKCGMTAENNYYFDCAD